MNNYCVKSSVLFIVFNRPDTTGKVFGEIRKVKPKKLYIAADGPRKSRPDEANVCEKTRAIVTTIDWDCEVFHLFRNENLGCKEAVSSAIDWFFSNEEEGIILEDDCLPAEDFFVFCDAMLDKYRDDDRIRHIAGINLQNKTWSEASYYFSNLTHVWGWASWRRVWKDYDKNLGKYEVGDLNANFRNVFNEPIIVASWVEIFNQLKQGKIDTWDYQLSLINMLNNGLSIIPNANLISNIGFNADATHTSNADNIYANLPIQKLATPLIHPIVIIPNKQADYYTLSHDFRVERKKRTYYRFKKTVRAIWKNFKNNNK